MLYNSSIIVRDSAGPGYIKKFSGPDIWLFVVEGLED